MARRPDYASFLVDRGRRRAFRGFEERIGLGAFIVPVFIVLTLGVSIWWFAFRDADADVAAGLTMEDASIPTLLLPSGSPTDDAGLLLSGVSIECNETVDDWPMFQGSTSREGCLQAPKISEGNARILWRVELGIAGWLNSPIVVNNTVYYGSAGVQQALQDRRDGVYALDLSDGEQKWFFGAALDVNGVAFGGGVIVATGDEGRVFGIDALSGGLIWEDDLGTAVFTNPLVVGSSVFVGDSDGVVTAYEIRSGSRLWQLQLDGPIRGGGASDGEVVVFASENRDIAAVTLGGRQIWRTELTGRGSSGGDARIYGAPTITDGLVVLTLLREDIFAEPAMAALSLDTGELVWRALDLAGIKHDWGNIRSSPAHVGDYLVYGEPYSNKVVAVEAATGETLWDVEVGAFCYPHWPSPAVVAGQAIVPRHDGGVYAIDIETETVAWSIFLGTSTSSGTFPTDFDADFCEWGPEDTYSILASPAVAPNGVVLVPTLEGYLVALGDRSWG